MTRARAVVALAVVALWGCSDTTVVPPGTSGSIEDGGPDAPPDAPADASGTGGGGGAGGGDGGVKPSGKDCPDTDVHDGRVCVSEGWFVLSRWTTAVWGQVLSEDAPFGPEPEQPVYLDAFWIDEHEVTHAAYDDYVKATGAAALPDGSGLNDYTSKNPTFMVPETCGWSAGEPLPELLEHPVVCVTRPDAAAYCAFRGGRLPTAVEWMKAGRGPLPDTRRYPWGDEPPKPTETATDADWADRYVVARGYVDELNTLPVYSDLLGRSPRSVLGLAGNASEILSTCMEDLNVVYPPDPELVRPKEPPKAECSEAVLVGGANWRSGANQAAGSQTLYRVQYDNYPYYVNDTDPGGDKFGWASFYHWYAESYIQGQGPRDPAGNDWRSWRIGFRCVYPLE